MQQEWERVYKSLYKLINELAQHTHLLEICIENIQYRYFLIVLPPLLRSLVTKWKWDHMDLLVFISKVFNFNEKIVIEGPKNQEKTLNQYLHHKALTFDNKQYTNIKIIKLLANDSWEWLHIRPYASLEYVKMQEIWIGWFSSIHYILLDIAKHILIFSKSLIEHIKSIEKEKLNLINKKYLEETIPSK